MIDLWLFLAKYTFLGLLYLFLFWAVRVIVGEARQLSNSVTTGVKANLRIVKDEGTPYDLPLTRSVAIGRLPDNDICLDDTAISGHHARIAHRGVDWVLEDLGSSNGTFLNDVRLDDRQRLKNSDRIRVGRTAISIEFRGID